LIGTLGGGIAPNPNPGTGGTNTDGQTIVRLCDPGPCTPPTEAKKHYGSYKPAILSQDPVERKLTIKCSNIHDDLNGVSWCYIDKGVSYPFEVTLAPSEGATGLECSWSLTGKGEINSESGIFLSDEFGTATVTADCTYESDGTQSISATLGVNVKENYCKEFDEGKNFNSVGIIEWENTGSSFRTEDTCTGETMLNEWYCDEYNVQKSETHDCDEGNEKSYACYGGACVLRADSCTDSDGGVDAEEKGSLSGYVDGYPLAGNEDFCVDGATLREWSCKDNTAPQFRDIACSEVRSNYVCDKGACVAPPPTMSVDFAKVPTSAYFGETASWNVIVTPFIAGDQYVYNLQGFCKTNDSDYFYYQYPPMSEVTSETNVTFTHRFNTSCKNYGVQVAVSEMYGNRDTFTNDSVFGVLPTYALSLSPSVQQSMLVGAKKTFNVSVVDQDGNPIENFNKSRLNCTVKGNGKATAVNKTCVFESTKAGKSTLTASYYVYEGKPISASVNITSKAAASSGGASSGGAVYRTATTASYTCAGKSGEINIDFLDDSATSALVQVFYTDSGNVQVLSKTVKSTSTSLLFTPALAGNYVLQVTVGKDTELRSFYVGVCTQENLNVTQTQEILLSPNRTLILNKTMDYPPYFSKEFLVYRIDNGQSKSYETFVTLFFKTNQSLANFTIEDGVPSDIVARASDVAFITYPTESQGSRFGWSIGSIADEGKLKFSYKFGQRMTISDINGLPAPALMVGSGGLGNEEPGILATLTGIGSSLTNEQLTGLAIAGVLLLALLLWMVFGRKKKDEPAEEAPDEWETYAQEASSKQAKTQAKKKGASKKRKK
jgi:hypothetical protein